jgi:hypothetical protein
MILPFLRGSPPEVEGRTTIRRGPKAGEQLPAHSLYRLCCLCEIRRCEPDRSSQLITIRPYFGKTPAGKLGDVRTRPVECNLGLVSTAQVDVLACQSKSVYHQPWLGKNRPPEPSNEAASEDPFEEK